MWQVWCDVSGIVHNAAPWAAQTPPERTRPRAEARFGASPGAPVAVAPGVMLGVGRAVWDGVTVDEGLVPVGPAGTVGPKRSGPTTSAATATKAAASAAPAAIRRGSRISGRCQRRLGARFSASATRLVRLREEQTSIAP